MTRPDFDASVATDSGPAATNLNAVAFAVKVVDQIAGLVSSFRFCGTLAGATVV